MPEEERTEEEVEEVEDQDVDDGDDGEDDEEDWTPPTKESFQNLEKAAKARKAELADVKKKLYALEHGKDQDDEDEKEAKKWRSTAARNSAATALSAAGFPGTAKQARLLTRLLDLDTAEPDSSGDFDFEDDIDDLKEQFPQLFAVQEEKRRAPRVTTSDKGRGQQTGRDRTSDKLLKQAGYA